jgi:phage terminase Nu1 subunit (DNA packaging protein)
MGDAMTEQLPDVDSATLARLLGVSPKIVYDLAKAGVIERGAGRLFDLEDSVQRYCDYLRQQQAAGDGGEG